MNQLPWEKINRRIIIKKEETTSKEYGCKPEDRTIKDLLNNGVICMNKQQGRTSHNFVDMVKKVINTSKIGHGGTLDPNVFGVLPIALGDATRITQALLPAGKEYVCLMHIHKDFNENQLKEIIKNISSFNFNYFHIINFFFSNLSLNCRSYRRKLFNFSDHVFNYFFQLIFIKIFMNVH